MNRDSKGRFCKAISETKEKNETKTKIPFLNVKHTRTERKFDKEPLLFHIKIVTNEKKNRFDRDDCINNASIFSKLDLDEQAKFIGGLMDMNDTCLNKYLQCLSYPSCSACFNDWFFNMFDPDTFHKILGD